MFSSGGLPPSQKLLGLCIYSNVVAGGGGDTRGVYWRPAFLVAVSIGESYLPSLCPRGAKNAQGVAIQGDAAVFLQNERHASGRPRSPPGRESAGKGPAICASERPHYIGPSHCQQGYDVVFYWVAPTFPSPPPACMMWPLTSWARGDPALTSTGKVVRCDHGS